jgi:hypothetical protein
MSSADSFQPIVKTVAPELTDEQQRDFARTLFAVAAYFQNADEGEQKDEIAEILVGSIARNPLAGGGVPDLDFDSVVDALQAIFRDQLERRVRQS